MRVNPLTNAEQYRCTHNSRLKNTNVLSIKQTQVKIIEDIPDNDYESLLRRHFVSKGHSEESSL